MTRFSLKQIVVDLGLIGAGVILAGCGQGQGNASAEAPPPAVTVVTSISQAVPVYLDEPVGKAIATESVTISPQVTGMLIARHFVDGADVHKGELLFEIDPRPFRAVLAQAQATLAQNKATLEFAKADYERVQKLSGTSAMSEEDRDTKKNAADVAVAQVAAAEAAVETAQLNLDYCRITSPIDGLAGQRLVDAGNVVSSAGPNGGTNLLVIQKLDPIYVDFTITERDLPNVQRYMGMGTLKVEASLPEDAMAAAPTAPPTTATAAPGTQPHASAGPRRGKVIFLDNSVQDGTGTIKLRAEVPNSDRHFWPGQFVKVRLVLTVQNDAVLIPNQAVQVSQQGPYVYVVKSDSTAELRPIVPGQRQGDLVVVDKGMARGEQVIVTGQTMVQPGKPVRVETGGPPRGMAAAVGHGMEGSDS